MSFLFLSTLASRNCSTKKIISRALQCLVGEYVGPVNEPKMKMVVKEWSKIRVFESQFSNNSALNLFQNLQTNEIIWEDPENLMGDLPLEKKNGLVSLIQNEDEMWADKVFDLISDVHSEMISPQLRGSPFVEKLMFAVAESVDVNRTNEMGHTPLMIASGTDGKSVLKLLQRKAEIEPIDTNDMTALHHAAYFGNSSACKILLDNGADINACAHLSSPLKEASRSDFANVDVVLILLRNGATFTEPDRFGRTPLQAAEHYLGKDDERIKILRNAEEQKSNKEKCKKTCCLESFFAGIKF